MITGYPLSTRVWSLDVPDFFKIVDFAWYVTLMPLLAAILT